ncbi:MAG TPA: ornithine cyclodeaminase family protein [Gemmatimonadales bacterium]
MRTITAGEVRAALPMTRAIDVMREAFTLLARGEVEMPLRTAVSLPGGGTFLTMSARAGSAFGAKLVAVLPHNPARRLPAVQAMVVMFDSESGAPAALIDGDALTAIRTGAVSGLATDLLARPDARRVAILGSGRQARTQLEAVCAVRAVDAVTVWSRSASNAGQFAAEMAGVGGVPRGIAVARSVAAAVDGADIVCTATPAARPILVAGHVRPGMHINAVGSFTRGMCEFEPGILRDARVIVDQREAALAEAGEVIAAVEGGLVPAEALIELGDLVNGAAVGRDHDRAVTLFKSVGLAVQDVVAGASLCSGS